MQLTTVFEPQFAVQYEAHMGLPSEALDPQKYEVLFLATAEKQDASGDAPPQDLIPSEVVEVGEVGSCMGNKIKQIKLQDVGEIHWAHFQSGNLSLKIRQN